jgi:hypothetical protein
MFSGTLLSNQYSNFSTRACPFESAALVYRLPNGAMLILVGPRAIPRPSIVLDDVHEIPCESLWHQATLASRRLTSRLRLTPASAASSASARCCSGGMRAWNLPE